MRLAKLSESLVASLVFDESIGAKRSADVFWVPCYSIIS